MQSVEEEEDNSFGQTGRLREKEKLESKSRQVVFVL
jgi:hypothetical protein